MKLNTNFLPENLHSILIGLMLGDGHLYKSSPTSNSRFEISFGKDRMLFANRIGKLFNEYSNTGIRVIPVKGTSFFSLKVNFRFKTKTLPIFNSYHNIFYEANNESWKYTKIVPHNILDLMDSTVLAYLIMTDGNFDKARNRVRIYTNSYSKADVERLALAINTNLNIYVGVLHDRKNQWILTIGAKQLILLREIVSPHFEPSMLYRIGINN
jgi:LAGLIDADG DNA endonuclease family